MAEDYAIPEVDLTVDTLLSEAIKAAGLDDFGDLFFMEALGVLVAALNDEAELNAVGRFMQYDRILNSLKNRLRMEEYLKRQPEILEQELLPAVVIVGLTRTGTTMLHRILASDSRFYAPLWYEVRNPAPYLDWDVSQKDQRISEAEAEVAMMLEANPELAAIHPMDPVGADEEVLLLEHNFYSLVPGSFANVPSYDRFVTESDNTAAYTYLRRQLLFLQWQKQQRGETAECWLLKAPQHLLFMDVLLKVFPQIKVIATHRDPVVTIPSTASFYYNLQLMGSDSADKLRVAESVSNIFSLGVQRLMKNREGRESSFLDVWFKDTATRPFEVIGDMYEFIGMELTAEARAAMERHRDEHKREDRPAHEYTLEEYGYTESGLSKQFEEYKRRFID